MLSKFKHNYKFFKKINFFKNSLLKIKSNKLNSLIKNIKFKKQKILLKIKLNKHKFIFNKQKKKLFTSYDRILLLLVGIVFLIISYLSIPFFYDSNKLIDKVKNELFKNLNINFNLTEDFSYNFFPRPVLSFQKVSFLDQVDNLGELEVDISPKNLFFLKNINIEDVTLKNINLNINKKNYNFFTELLKNDYSDFKFEIKNSNIFYRNIKNDVLFINKINKLKYYYDKKKFSNFLIANNEIFIRP
jgi:disulfide oxidoreductase YuzD